MDLDLESFELFLKIYSLGIALFSFKFMISKFLKLFFSFFLGFLYFQFFPEKIPKLQKTFTKKKLKKY